MTDTVIICSRCFMLGRRGVPAANTSMPGVSSLCQPHADEAYEAWAAWWEFEAARHEG